jgi:glutathione S-transferase
MRCLFHHPLHPQSRAIRLQLAEKRLEAELVLERPWDRREQFLALNPAGEVPVLVEDGGLHICGFYPILEHLEEAYPETAATGTPLLGRNPVERAEIRRLVAWFNEKFERDVTRHLLHEKIFKRFMPGSGGGPDSAAIRAGKANIGIHLDYIAWLVERRKGLVCADEVPPQLPAAAGRQSPRRPAPAALRGSGFLKHCPGGNSPLSPCGRGRR